MTLPPIKGMTPKGLYEERVREWNRQNAMPPGAYRTWEELPPDVRSGMARDCETWMSLKTPRGNTYVLYAHAHEEDGGFWLGISRQPAGDDDCEEEGDHIFNFDLEDDDTSYPSPAEAFAYGVTLVYQRFDPYDGVRPEGQRLPERYHLTELQPVHIAGYSGVAK